MCVHVLFFSTWCVALLIIRLHPPYNNLIKKQTIKTVLITVYNRFRGKGYMTFQLHWACPCWWTHKVEGWALYFVRPKQEVAVRFRISSPLSFETAHLNKTKQKVHFGITCEASKWIFRIGNTFLESSATLYWFWICCKFGQRCRC